MGSSCMWIITFFLAGFFVFVFEKVLVVCFNKYGEFVLVYLIHFISFFLFDEIIFISIRCSFSRWVYLTCGLLFSFLHFFFFFEKVLLLCFNLLYVVMFLFFGKIICSYWLACAFARALKLVYNKIEKLCSIVLIYYHDF